MSSELLRIRILQLSSDQLIVALNMANGECFNYSAESISEARSIVQRLIQQAAESVLGGIKLKVNEDDTEVIIFQNF